MRARRIERLRAAMAAALLSWAGAAAAAGVPADLDAVMNELARAPHGDAAFTETQFLKLLDKPLQSSGVLIYRPPDYLEKRTLQPRASSLIADGDRLTVQRGRRKHELRLSEFPQAAPFIDCIRAALAGDRARLEAHFSLQFSGSLQQWQLALTPLDAAAGVRRIDISGAGGQLRRVDILQSDADRSELLILPPP
jgi:outer membrane lipoprotein-sorting protein